MTLAWDPNTEPDLGGYIIYYGPASRVYTNAVNVGNVTNYTVRGLVDNAWYFFAATAYSTNGLESDFSDEVSFFSGGGENRPPTVYAGPNQTIHWPATITLRGAATDDGQPNPPGLLTTTWSKVSGPGTVTFADASRTNTTATCSAPGVYVLRLTAHDGARSASAEVTVVMNGAPTVFAGLGQTITWPAAAILQGTATDDGAPNPPGRLTTLWSRVSGPGAVTFADPTFTNTVATFSTYGTYVLQLVATDGALSATGLVTILVRAAPLGQSPPTISALPAQSTAEGALTVFYFTVSDLDTPVSLLTVKAKSSNQALVPDAQILVSGSRGTRTLSLTPLPRRMGQTTITVTVSDGTSATSTAFPLTVQPVLRIERTGTQAVLWWEAENGRLQEADQVTGPWRDVSPAPHSPFYITPVGAKMYRLRAE